MMKKLRKIVVVVFVLALLPLVALAAANDVTVSADISWVLDNGDTYTTDGAVAQSIQVSTNSLLVTVLTGSSVVITSSDKRDFSASGLTLCATVEACNANESTLTISCPSTATSAETVTVTGSGTCTSGSIGGGSGGGGGGVVAPVVTPVVQTPTTTPAVETKQEETKAIEATQTFAVGTSSSVSVGSQSHTVTVNSATATTAEIVIKSDPITVSLVKDVAQEVDTDKDGVKDLKVTYLGLDENSKPKIKFEDITVAKTETKADATAKETTCALTKESAYKYAGSKAVYYITKDCTKRPFKSSKIYFTYFKAWSDVKTTTKASIDAVPNDALGFMPFGPLYDPQYGAIVKIVSDPKVYLLLGSTKYWIASEAVFNTLKYSWNWIEDISDSLLAKYSTGSEITDTTKHPNYTLIKYKNSPKVYRLEDGKKRHIKNEKAFNNLKYRWDRIVTIDASETYPDGAVLE
jgi:hypothetical protein